MTKHKWRPFIVARAWAREQGIRSGTQWRELCKHGTLPSDIPKSPSATYKNEWKSWGDFLGTGFIASQHRHYRPFVKAREWARAQGLNTHKDWLNLAAAQKIPEDIPTNVRQVYLAEWKGMSDFLGSRYVAPRNRKYRSFALARKWARRRGLKSEKEWREHSKRAGWLPNDIPVNVYQTYRSEWTSWGDFLGSGYVANQKRFYRPFEEAREWARAQGLKSKPDWLRLVAEKRLPGDIPADPRNAYGKAFTSFGDFLGTGNLASSNYQWAPYAEAKSWARHHKVNTSQEWRDLANFMKTAKQWPTNVPTNVALVYRSEWEGWEEFLGVPKMAKRSKVEERLKHELASALPGIDLMNRVISIPGEKKLEIDIHAPTLRLVIEFDGNYWHSSKGSEARDRAKTQLLQNAGWTVVRIREHPLDPISATDLRIPTKLTTFKLAVTVLTHLSTLGYVAKAAVVRYEAGGKTVRGHGASSAIREAWLPFAEAQAWVRAQGIKSQSQWMKQLKQHGWLHSNIPRYPLEVYRDQCATWGEFLGTNRKATFLRIYRSFAEAREWARSKQLKSGAEWKALAKREGWLPDDIPANVYQTYKRKDEWTSWGDFLGTGNVAPGARK